MYLVIEKRKYSRYLALMFIDVNIYERSTSILIDYNNVFNVDYIYLVRRIRDVTVSDVAAPPRTECINSLSVLFCKEKFTSV